MDPDNSVRINLLSLHYTTRYAELTRSSDRSKLINDYIVSELQFFYKIHLLLIPRYNIRMQRIKIGSVRLILVGCV
jgi:hypothetical protein